MSFAGAAETYNATNTELNHGSMFRLRDDDMQIYWGNKNSAEFYKLLKFLASGRTLVQPRWDFGKNDKTKPYLIVKNDVASGGTAIDVFDAYNCVAGDVLYNSRTKEQIRLDAIDDADTVSVATTTGYGRGFGNTTAAAMRAGDYLHKRGRVMGEHGTAPAANNKMPTRDYNYCEWWVKTIQSGNVQESTRMLDGVGQRDETYMRKIWEMDEEINGALMFGKRNLVYNATEASIYTMNGLDQQILTHAISGANVTNPTWELFNEWLSPTFDATSSSDAKVLFCGKNLYSVILSAARAVGISPQRYLTVLGSVVTRLDVDGGYIDIMKDYKTLNGPLSGDGFLVDSAHVEFRPFNNYNRHVITDVQDRDEIMIKKDTVIQAGSLALFHEESHATLKNFNGPFNSWQ